MKGGYMQDFEIVQMYLDRNEQAINETKNKYGNYCYAIAHNILHNNEDSQEVVNDTYLATWDAIPPHHPLNLSTFIGKITRRLSLNKWRNENAQKRGGGQTALSFEELEACIPDNKSFKDELDAKILAESINGFLALLKPEQRKVFVCRYWFFESIEDIAKNFNYSQSKVKMILKRTRDNLKDYLIKEGYYEG